MLPLDYYIKPQYLDQLESYRLDIVDLFTNFATLLKIDTSGLKIDEAVTKIVQLQVKLALNFIPNDLLKNARLQFNNYTVENFDKSYPQITNSYFKELLKDIFLDEPKILSTEVVVTQSRYYRALDGILQDDKFQLSDLANYFAFQFIFANSDFIGGETREIVKRIKSTNFQKRQKQYDQHKLACVGTVQTLMPYGYSFSWFLCSRAGLLIKLDVLYDKICLEGTFWKISKEKILWLNKSVFLDRFHRII